MAATISRQAVWPGKARGNADTCSSGRDAREILAAVFSPIDSVAEIVIEVAKAKLRIIGAPDPHTVQIILQQLLR